MKQDWTESRTLLIALGLVFLVVIVTTYLYRLERRHQEELREAAQQTLDLESNALAARSSGRIDVTLSFFRPHLLSDNLELLYGPPGNSTRDEGPRERLIELEERSIFATEDAILTARQIVHEVLKGPGLENFRLFSERARLRQIYLLKDGTALLDLTRETLHPEVAGISTELAALYSLARSVIENVENIERVKFLVEGEERPTLAGHVSIREPFE